MSVYTRVNTDVIGVRIYASHQYSFMGVRNGYTHVSTTFVGAMSLFKSSIHSLVDNMAILK